MHNDWEELIPFYVAGSLPRAETSRLESHLSRCERCRASVEEWRALAAVVRADAAAQLRDLPPLSSRVLQVATREAGSRRAQPQAQRRQPLPFRSASQPVYRPTSVTLIAALFTVILFGGLLALMVLRGSFLLPQPAAESVVLLPTATPFRPQSAAPSPAPQIIVIEPSATPVTPASELPTKPPPVILTAPPLIFSTPLPPSATRPPFVATRRPPTAEPPMLIPAASASADPSLESFALQMPAPDLALKDACTLHAAASAASLYAGPGLYYGIVSTFSAADALPVLAVSDNNWFQAQSLDGSIGWVPVDQVYTSGSCDSLAVIAAAQPTEALPTPTAYSGVPVAVVSADSVNLRGGPDTIYPVVALALAGERLPVIALARASSGIWYLVESVGQGAVWVSASVVELLPADAFIPAAATIPPSPAPTATIIPFMPTSTPTAAPPQPAP